MRCAALGLVVALALSSCTRAAPPQPTPGEDVASFGYPHEPPTLDPLALGGDAPATRDILRPTLPALFRLDPQLRPEPDLVEDWPDAQDVGDDPFSVTVTLREATWSDGRPITATDVRFTWERFRDSPSAYRYADLRDVEVVGERRVRLVFERPVRRWWALFSIDDMVLPAHAYDDSWATTPTVSGGPFAFDSWEPGLRVRLVRNDAFWGQPATLAGLDVLFVPDEETRLELTARGELDGFFSEGEINMARRAIARGFAVSPGDTGPDGDSSGAWGATWWELRMDPDRVRAPVARAVMEAADPVLAAEIFEDDGQVLDGLPALWPPPGPHCEACPPIDGPWAGRGDLDEARAILSEAGYRRSGDDLIGPAGPVVFQMAYERNPAAGGLARFIHFRARELGIRIELVGLESETFHADFVPKQRASAFLRLERGADAPDAGRYGAASGQPAGVAAADEAITRARSARTDRTGEPTVGLDADAWSSATRIVAGSGAVAPLARVRTWIVAPGLTGVRAAGSAAGPLWDAGAWQRRPTG